MLEENRTSIELSVHITMHDLQIFFYYLKGFSIDLIIAVTYASCRAYVRNVIKEFMSSRQINVRKLIQSSSFTYYGTKNKVIESKYYNKNEASDFSYIK